MIRAKDLLLLLSRPTASTKEPQKERQRQENNKLPHLYKWSLVISSLLPGYLCELLVAAQFLSEGVELRCDLLVGPAQLSGRNNSILPGTLQYVDVTL